MRQRVMLIVITCVICILSVGACRREIPPEPVDNTVDTSEMELMYTTAYCLHGITASGGQTRPGIAACNIHLGDVALVYTTDGVFLGAYEITDTGITDGLTSGRVLDVWRANKTHAKGWMKLTDGRVYVQWIEGDG